jgi:hypothetical protein
LLCHLGYYTGVVLVNWIASRRKAMGGLYDNDTD